MASLIRRPHFVFHLLMQTKHFLPPRSQLSTTCFKTFYHEAATALLFRDPKKSKWKRNFFFYYSVTPLDLSWELLGGFKAQIALTHGYQSIHCTADGRRYSWRLYIWLLSVRNPMMPSSQKNSQLCQSHKSPGASMALWPIGLCPELPSRRLGFVGCWGFFGCSSVGLGTIIGCIYYLFNTNTWWQHHAGHHILTLCHAHTHTHTHLIQAYTVPIEVTSWPVAKPCPTHMCIVAGMLSLREMHILSRRAKSMLFWLSSGTKNTWLGQQSFKRVKVMCVTFHSTFSHILVL